MAESSDTGKGGTCRNSQKSVYHRTADAIARSDHRTCLSALAMVESCTYRPSNLGPILAGRRCLIRREGAIRGKSDEAVVCAMYASGVSPS